MFLKNAICWQTFLPLFGFHIIFQSYPSFFTGFRPTWILGFIKQKYVDLALCDLIDTSHTRFVKCFIASFSDKVNKFFKLCHFTITNEFQKSNTVCDALRNLVPFVQFKKCEKHPWRSVNFNQVTKSNTPPWMFFTFFKLYKWYQIAQNITYSSLIAQLLNCFWQEIGQSLLAYWCKFNLHLF